MTTENEGPERAVCDHVLDSGGDDGACGECYGWARQKVIALEAERERLREDLKLETALSVSWHKQADELRAALRRLLDAHSWHTDRPSVTRWQEAESTARAALAEKP